jgi:hypothetical protein
MGYIMQLLLKKHKALLIAGAIGVTALTGCSQVIKTGANVALRFAENRIVPPILTVGDTNMACLSSTSMTPLIIATQSMGADPTKLGVLMYSGAALCSEQAALEQELSYLRAARAGQVEVAQYAAYRLFAENYQRKYKVTIGDPNKCPKMRKDLDKMVYMLGLLSGLQAVTNDIASGGSLNVPQDIGAIVERGMTCLDNQQFWGAPNAIRAAIWTLLPGAGDGKPDPYVTLKESTRIGEASGVRLAHAVYAITAQSSGKDEIIRDALRTYGRTLEKPAVNKQYELFDAMGALIVQSVADRYWTEKTGTRTPDNGFNQFWDEKPDVPDIDVDLDDIF